MIPTWVTAPKHKGRDGLEQLSNDLYINDLIKYIKGGVLIPPAAQNPLVVAAPALATNPTQSAPVIFEGAQDGVHEMFSVIGAFDAATAADVQARFSVLITDQAYRRRYMNRDVLVNHIFGTPGNPLFLPKSVMLENQQVMIWQFFNNSTAGAATFRMSAESRVFQAQSLTNNNVTQLIGQLRKESMFLNPFWLTSNNPVVVPASGFVTALFSNTRDYYLILRYILATRVTAGVAGDTQEVFSATIRDAKTQRPLMNAPITMNMCSGIPGFPYVLPCPMLVEPNTSIQIDFTNLITDAPTEIFFTFCGVGVYVANANPWENQVVDNPAVTNPVYGIG